ncbi:MAG: VWA domain-containing protein [Boseongicola sp.]|nr:VWA domain-containing protein [Boseongicola sp.]
MHPDDSLKDLPPPPPQTEETQRDDTGDDGESQSGLSEVVLGAAKTALPEDVLSEIAKRTRLAMGRGDGLARISKRRGRPLPSRPGKLDGRNRLDLLATLNAAAPWQRLRNAEPGSLSLRLSDIRVKRYRDRSERILIFAVDASGSAAMARLAEAKGAAEVLLAKAYESRDEVALAVFRKDAAELILPPTRSLTRAKRLLSAMPAGGATPLAQGIRLATDLGVAAQRAGKAAQVILMTDGRANCALDGSKDRQIAQSDAMAMASHLRTVGVPCVILDSGRRPSQQLTQLAQQLDAEIVALPRLGEALTTNVAP